MSSLKKYLVLLLVLILILSFGTAACNWDWLFGPKAPDDNDDDKDKEECEYPLEPPIGNVGDTIRSCHFEVTLNWAEKTDYYKGARPRRDRENNTLVVLYATIKLTKSKGYFRSDIACFRIKDDQENIYSWDGLAADDWIPQVELGQGQEVSGTSIIEVPKAASGLTAIFRALNADIYQDQIKWKLGF